MRSVWLVAMVATAWLLWGCLLLVGCCQRLARVVARWNDRAEIAWLLSRAAKRIRQGRGGAKGGRHGG